MDGSICKVQVTDRDDHILQLSPVGTGVHEYAAPDRSRDPGGKLQPGERMLQRNGGKT